MRGGIIAASEQRRITLSAPTVVLNGVFNGSTTSATYAIPDGYAVNDIFVLSVESGATAGVTTVPSGWALMAAPRAQGSNVTTLSVLYRRATSLSETNPTVAAQNNHQTGVITVIRGVTTNEPPFESLGASGQASATSVSHAAGTSTGAQELVMLFIASQNGAADQFGTFSNTSLSSVTKQNAGGTALGNAGSLDVVSGVRATAGTLGTFTATAVSGNISGQSFAFKPAG